MSIRVSVSHELGFVSGEERYPSKRDSKAVLTDDYTSTYRCVSQPVPLGTGNDDVTGDGLAGGQDDDEDESHGGVTDGEAE